MPINILAPNDPALNAYATALDEQNPDDIKLYIVPFAEYRAALDETLNAPVSTYEVVFVPGHLWIPELAAAEKLLPLNDIMGALPAEVEAYQASTLLSHVVDEAEYDGAQYMLPLFSDGHILFYNPKQVSISTNIVDPSTMLSLAQSIRPHKNTLALKAHPAEIFLDFLPYLLQASGNILDENNQPTFNNPAAIKALEDYAALAQFGPPNTHEFGNEEIAETMIQATVAMTVTWGGQAAPIFLRDETLAPQTYKAAVFTTPWNATWGAAIPTNLQNPVQRNALKGLLRLNQPSMDGRVLTAAGSPIRSTTYTKQAMKQYPWLAAQRVMLDRAVMLPKLPQIGAVLGTFYDNVYQAFRGKKPAEIALADTEAAVLKVFEA